jgi:hypothetical protein
MVMRVKKDKDMKYWIIFGTVVGILYPIGEYFFAPQGWGTHSIGDLFVLSTPTNMILLLLFSTAYMGYLSRKAKTWQIVLLALTLTFVIENFNAQAGFWSFNSELVLWHAPLYIVASETISLSVLKYFRVKAGPMLFAGFSGLMWMFLHLLIP